MFCGIIFLRALASNVHRVKYTQVAYALFGHAQHVGEEIRERKAADRSNLFLNRPCVYDKGAA